MDDGDVPTEPWPEEEGRRMLSAAGGEEEEREGFDEGVSGSHIVFRGASKKISRCGEDWMRSKGVFPVPTTVMARLWRVVPL